MSEHETPSSRKAPFITIEGVDGAGKSSHLPTILNILTQRGWEVVQTNEPGGTPLGFRLREEILKTPMANTSEVLLAFASRQENLDQVIRPALAKGVAVLCDRFTDSTYAYQGRAGRCPDAYLKTLEDLVHPDFQPDLTLLFDLPVSESKKRLGGTGKVPDKFESQGEAYFNLVREGYLDRVKADPKRFAVIDASPSLQAVAEQVEQAVHQFLDQWEAKPQRRFKP